MNVLTQTGIDTTVSLLCFCSSDVAMTYNDKAVLENYHASTVFRILKEENYNILANLKKEDYRFVKKTLVHFCPLRVPENSVYAWFKSVSTCCAKLHSVHCTLK